MKFFSDLQRTRNVNNQMHDENSKLKKEIDALMARL